MSYLSKRMQRASKTTLGPRGRGMGLGNAIEDFFDSAGKIFNDAASAEETAANKPCLDAGNASSAQMLAKASDLSKNWNPPGLYSLEQFQSLIQSTMTMLTTASTKVSDVAAQPMGEGSRAALGLKIAAVQRKTSTEGMVFVEALRQATSSGIKTIDAPGLKSWVVNSMIVAADAITGATYVACQTPWWVSALAAFQAVFDKVWRAAKQVAGVALELGEQVLKIPDAIGQIWTYATYGAVALIAWWAYENVPHMMKGA